MLSSFDESIYRDLITTLCDKNIRCNFTSNVDHSIFDFKQYIKYNLANKLNKNGKNITRNQEKGLIDDPSGHCCSLNIDILFEKPKRIINKFIQECQFAKTRKQKILLGIVEPNSNPYYLEPVEFGPNPKKQEIKINNVNYVNEAIRESLFNGFDNYNDDIRTPGKEFTEKDIVISEDIEVWATKRHFENEGYDKTLLKYYYPENIEKMLRAMYYDNSPEIKEMMSEAESKQFKEMCSEYYTIQKTKRYEQVGIVALNTNDVSVNRHRRNFENILQTMNAIKLEKGFKTFKYEDYKMAASESDLAIHKMFNNEKNITSDDKDGQSKLGNGVGKGPKLPLPNGGGANGKIQDSKTKKSTSILEKRKKDDGNDDDDDDDDDDKSRNNDDDDDSNIFIKKSKKTKRTKTTSDDESASNSTKKYKKTISSSGKKSKDIKIK